MFEYPISGVLCSDSPIFFQYDWYFEEEEGDPPVEPPTSAEELSPAPAPSRDLLIHNVKKIEGT